jgi:predicted GTPase
MHKASEVLKLGADFRLMSGKYTMIPSKKPVVAICAVRTGVGKSQTTRRVANVLRSLGKKVAIIRHPMPYGNLVEQKVQRFETLDDMIRHKCTIEEMEEYEPHIVNGSVVYAGVDYAAILDQAEKEADVILWDGGNNDLSFYKPDLYITLVDPHRPGHEMAYYPGEANFRLADVLIINKIETAKPEGIAQVKENIKKINPEAILIEAESPISVSNPEMIKDKRVLVVEDGPTLTHGEMQYGAGVMAAKKFGAKVMVNPKAYAVGEMADTFKKYPQIGNLLPAMGYSEQQIKDLETTINRVECDVVISATPINLLNLININKPAVRVTYDLKEATKPDLMDILSKFVQEHCK